MSTSSLPKLYYFQLAGRGDVIRTAFALGNVPFEDIRMTLPQFVELKQQGKFPMGQVPALELADGMVLGQTVSILRYVGRITKLYPIEDSVLCAQIDQALDDISEINGPLSTSCELAGQEQKEARAKLCTEVLPRIAEDLEKRIKANPSGYIVGPNLTIADLYLTFMWEFIFEINFFDHIRCDVLLPYPSIKALMAKVLGHPVVKQYREKNPLSLLYKLYYFDAPGRAEVIRLALAAGGIAFEDVRLTPETFPEFSRTKAPMGSVPVLEVFHIPNGIQYYCQTDAILRFVGRRGGLYPTCATEALVVDQLLQAMEEFFTRQPCGNLTAIYLSKDEKEKRTIAESWAKDNAPDVFALLTAAAEKNKAHGWLVGDKMTTADITLFHTLNLFESEYFREALKGLVPELPLLRAIAAKVRENPSVQRWYSQH